MPPAEEGKLPAEVLHHTVLGTAAAVLGIAVGQLGGTVQGLRIAVLEPWALHPLVVLRPREFAVCVCVCVCVTMTHI
jgi:hypothetical protein